VSLQQWAALVEEVNGRPAVTRDPENPCDGWKPGTPQFGAACETDGHYMCDGCEGRASCDCGCGNRPSRCACEECPFADECPEQQPDYLRTRHG
jgi:hypothetical protein